jgi:hypothetical protein
MILYDPIVDEPKKPVFFREGTLKTDTLVVSSFFELDHRLVLRVLYDLIQEDSVDGACAMMLFKQVSGNMPVIYEFDINGYFLLVKRPLFYYYMVEEVKKHSKPYYRISDFDHYVHVVRSWDDANSKMLNLFDAVGESKDHTKDEW